MLEYLRRMVTIKFSTESDESSTDDEEDQDNDATVYNGLA